MNVPRVKVRPSNCACFHKHGLKRIFLSKADEKTVQQHEEELEQSEIERVALDGNVVVTEPAR